MASEYCLSVSISHFAVFLKCRKILRHGANGFTFPPNEVVLRIFIAIKNPSLWAWFEPANLPSKCLELEYRPENWLFILRIFVVLLSRTIQLFIH
jgi:hypothetical protein